MAARRLAIELEPTHLQSLNDLPVSESREAAHLPGNHNCVVPPLIGCGQIGYAVALALSLDQPAGDVARDVEGLGDGPALCDQARELMRSCEEHSFRQFLNLYPNRQLHMS
jgi:hypothetical protein